MAGQEPSRRVLVIGTAAALFLALVAVGLWFLLSPKPEAKNDSLNASCADVVGRMLQETDCTKKLSLYGTHIKQCRDRYVLTEKPEPYETIFADEIFEVFRCFRDNGDANAAKNALSLALENPDWQMNGPGGCGGHLMAKAELEAISRQPTGPCATARDLDGLVDKAVSPFSAQNLERFLGGGQVLSSGHVDSDDVCPETFADIKTWLDQALPGSPTLVRQRRETSDVSTRVYLGESTKGSTRLILDFSPVDQCLYLSTVIVEGD